MNEVRPLLGRQVRPLSLYLAIETFREGKLWVAQVLNHPETRAMDESKMWAVDKALDLAKKSIWPDAQM